MIRTFIFCDLETTGLISKNFMPKVTEVALIAVSRNDICNTTEFLPRVLHKLVLPVNPNVHISEKIQTLTGMSNENLAEAQHFNCEVHNLVTNFINRQAMPICFVAYNGNNFDYPILLSEFKSINKNCSDDILSIDMLHLIKDFFSNKEGLTEKVNDTQTSTSVSCSGDVSILLDDGYDKILSDALDSIMKTHLDDGNNGAKSIVKKEKIIPGFNGMHSTPQTSCYKKIQQINEKTPENQIIKLQHSNKNVNVNVFQNKKGTSARRKLDFTNSRPTSFKLSNVCRHIFGSDPQNAHSAEGDCLTMIRCAVQLGSYFVEWSDGKAVPLNNYSKQ